MNLFISMPGWDLAPWADRLADYLPGRKIITGAGPYDPASVQYAAVWNHPPHSLAGFKNTSAVVGAAISARIVPRRTRYTHLRPSAPAS